jgi:hypothetical protein
VTSPDSEDDHTKFCAVDVKGMIMNPIYAGLADNPRIVSDEQWVSAARRILEEDGPDQFLVNLLYVLRRTFGCIEWGADLPPDRN